MSAGKFQNVAKVNSIRGNRERVGDWQEEVGAGVGEGLSVYTQSFGLLSQPQ